MSELIQKNDNRATIRWKLLTGASVLVLTAYVSSGDLARAEDGDKPQVWIELGGQLSRLEDGQETFSPPLMASRPPIFASSQQYERPPLFSITEEGKISFQPDNSSWVFSASIQYGRSAAKRHVLQQTNPGPFEKYIVYGGVGHSSFVYPAAQKFSETKSRNSEDHRILDFEAGKDFGLGMFGNKDATSTISAGVRFAQFGSKTNISLKSDPDWHFESKYLPVLGGFYITNGQPFHSNLASMTAQRSFHGIGPSVSWKASAPLAGNVQDGAIVVDWGLNAAMLFGRQKTRTHHQTTARYFSANGRLGTRPVVPHTVSRFPATPDHTRSRNVTVPTVGGFAGLSYNYANAKLSFGYKADFFFGAIDGGIDARKNENRGFFGPYASISIGLGD